MSGHGKVAAHPVEAHHRRVADEIQERVCDVHLRPAVCQRYDVDPGEILAPRHVLVGVQFGRDPGVAQLHGH